ncbi:uncharacterized protein PHALS_13774 [Plasmopara halstedii]|uniref:Uncharacterized protein n=1 Tax=Plasmopara halstedii TaxID=4781 RepID=A0A0P1AQP9_PLAHL|nr:uncharacterized protein PHALS_13774 [Plasmopara halstedii]CEG43582.1 hypothetical protein PHALS_13774 [Plasmopara halstedii]|eukprot:XP_024579951.1 hypothetical protein PHALS_13774 [Plasmopara halstedii]
MIAEATVMFLDQRASDSLRSVYNFTEENAVKSLPVLIIIHEDKTSSRLCVIFLLKRICLSKPIFRNRKYMGCRN